MVESVGISKSSVSRQFIEESAQEPERLAVRCFEHLELLIIYLDGLIFGEHHVLGAVGGDAQGNKHVMGLAEGTSENAALATVLPGRPGGAAGWVFGSGSPVQRCRHHKIKNVCDQLPDDLADQVKAVTKAAYQTPWQEGMARLKKQADWLETYYPGAAAGLREGLE